MSRCTHIEWPDGTRTFVGADDAVYLVKGHPRDPSTFSETISDRLGVRRVTRSYVAYSRDWPWWRRWLATMFDL